MTLHMRSKPRLLFTRSMHKVAFYLRFFWLFLPPYLAWQLDMTKRKVAGSHNSTVAGQRTQVACFDSLCWHSPCRLRDIPRALNVAGVQQTTRVGKQLDLLDHPFSSLFK